MHTVYLLGCLQPDNVLFKPSWHNSHEKYHVIIVPYVGSRVIRIDPLRFFFLVGCHTRQLNQVLSCYILACFLLYCCLLGPLLCIVSFRSYVFCLLVVLVKLSVLAKWLLQRHLWGSLTVARGSFPQSPGWRVFMIFWFIVLFHCSIICLSCPPGPTWYIPYFYGTI